ncbi:GxxExxY protein [Niabella drilacis]|uniref:GxxExxY protein n=1 Tax=Niabella drilacis (strain DSM 25811 / CCM 8410 / CCUG 62505 / LMG 26954 / E90) TaxID=1285928 RepID=UPI000A7D4A33
MLTKKYLGSLAHEITGYAIEVHKIKGRGLLESVYHQCLKEELLHRKIPRWLSGARQDKKQVYYHKM